MSVPSEKSYVELGDNKHYLALGYLLISMTEAELQKRLVHKKVIELAADQYDQLVNHA